jgi:transposase InsO family protein
VLKEKIIALAQRHRRYGVGMIYLKLRQAGELINHKRVVRLYAEAGLQVKKRKRKKIPLSDRHPLERPTAANQVWSHGLRVCSDGRGAQHQEPDGGG